MIYDIKPTFISEYKTIANVNKIEQSTILYVEEGSR